MILFYFGSRFFDFAHLALVMNIYITTQYVVPFPRHSILNDFLILVDYIIYFMNAFSSPINVNAFSFKVAK